MIRQIFRQLWQQRRANGWIWAELVVVTYFLWLVIDPVYVLLANRAIDDGYSLEDTYHLKFNEYNAANRLYKPEMSSDSVRVENFQRIVSYIKQYPGVVATAVVQSGSYPQSTSWADNSFFNDTIKTWAQQFGIVTGSDYFEVFRMKQANGKSVPTTVDERSVYINSILAKKLFPNGEEAVGKFITDTDSTSYRVVAILSDIKSRSIRQPSPLFVMVKNYEASYIPEDIRVCFRVRDGLASAEFAEKFKKEMRPRLQVGNYYLESLMAFHTLSRKFEYSMGSTNTLRLQSGMALFFLLCTFLGVSGTFWLRCNARREEIGTRMALGSSRKTILKQFLTESWLLVTAGFIIGLFIVLQQVYADGFAYPTRDGDPTYLQNQPVAHFLLVSGVTYLLMLVIALLGTWIPAARAAKTSPSEALRDE